MRLPLPALAAPVAASTAALRNHAIRRVMLAFFAYNAVELGAWTAILIYAYTATGPASVGLVAVAQLLPSAVVAPFMANVGDRFPRAHVLLGWYVAQAAGMTAIGLAILLGAPPLLVYAIAIVSTIAMTQTRPTQAALLPELADTPGELTAANALSSIGEGVGGFAGPLGVGVLLAFADPSVAFFAGSAGLLGGGLLVAGIQRHRGAPSYGGDGEPQASVSAAVLLAGLRQVSGDRDLLIVMALLTGRLVIFGGLEVLTVLMAIDLLGLGESGAGYLMAALGIGIVGGGGAAFALAGRRRLAPWLGVAAVIVGLPIAVIGIAPEARTAALLLMVAGTGLAVLDVAGQTLLQRITPDAIRARVFGVLEGLLLAGEALGSVVIAPIAALLGLDGAAVALGLLLPVLAALAVVRFARIDARVSIPETELRALRGVTMLTPLGPAALETLARQLVRVTVAPGDVVIREGDHGDRWYLVAHGRFTVAIGGEVRRELGPGDMFGEIALLRDVPRTATVVAIEAGRLWALDRDQFLAAVGGSPSARLEAERIAAARLAGS